MASPPVSKPTAKAGIVGSLKRKAGPLPVWAWSLILLGAGYYLYRHYQASQANGSSDTIPTLDATAIPASDQAGGGLGGGGAGTDSGGTVNNYYTNNPKLTRLEKEVAQLIKIDKNQEKEIAHLEKNRGRQTDKSRNTKPHKHPHDKSRPTRKHTKTTARERKDLKHLGNRWPGGKR